MSSGQKRRIPANFPNMNYRRRAELRHVQRSWAQAFSRVLAGLDAWMLAQWDDIPTDGSVEIRRPSAAILGERVLLTEKGRAVIESGLTVRQAHEIETGCQPDALCAECREVRGA